MANKTDKWTENIGGKFYVDQQCIDCDLCRETAPGFFTRHDEGGYSFVHKQPTTEEEIALCMEALEGCPVEATARRTGRCSGLAPAITPMMATISTVNLRSSWVSCR